MALPEEFERLTQTVAQRYGLPTSVGPLLIGYIVHCIVVGSIPKDDPDVRRLLTVLEKRTEKVV
jgi:hypothetical protein